MKITILAVGKIKEKYMKTGIREYMQRLKHYTRVNVVHVKEEKLQGKRKDASALERVKEIEGERLLERVQSGSYAIALSVDGETLSSEELADRLRELRLHGKSDITFIIGGPYGLASEVLERADFTLSCSEMTFTHQMIRLILLEQIYRAFKIMKNEPYHK